MHSTFEWMSWSQLTILRLMRLSLTNDGALWCSRIELSIGILKVVCLSKGKGKGCQCHSVVWAHGRNECSWKTKIMICMLVSQPQSSKYELFGSRQIWAFWFKAIFICEIEAKHYFCLKTKAKLFFFWRK